jgi:hypothetical protein
MGCLDPTVRTSERHHVILFMAIPGDPMKNTENATSEVRGTESGL